ncbi:hypothetical protein ABW20_dc0101546 [Dactylellina cionopaga]|nr:hypothetical protein ABW20_dc0101546 [Dactylellina cionopaga]
MSDDEFVPTGLNKRSKTTKRNSKRPTQARATRERPKLAPLPSAAEIPSPSSSKSHEREIGSKTLVEEPEITEVDAISHSYLEKLATAAIKQLPEQPVRPNTNDEPIFRMSQSAYIKAVAIPQNEPARKYSPSPSATPDAEITITDVVDGTTILFEDSLPQTVELETTGNESERQDIVLQDTYENYQPIIFGTETESESEGTQMAEEPEAPEPDNKKDRKISDDSSIPDTVAPEESVECTDSPKVSPGRYTSKIPVRSHSEIEEYFTPLEIAARAARFPRASFSDRNRARKYGSILPSNEGLTKNHGDILPVFKRATLNKLPTFSYSPLNPPKETPTRIPRPIAASHSARRHINEIPSVTVGTVVKQEDRYHQWRKRTLEGKVSVSREIMERMRAEVELEAAYTWSEVQAARLLGIPRYQLAITEVYEKNKDLIEKMEGHLGKRIMPEAITNLSKSYDLADEYPKMHQLSNQMQELARKASEFPMSAKRKAREDGELSSSDSTDESIGRRTKRQRVPQESILESNQEREKLLQTEVESEATENQQSDSFEATEDTMDCTGDETKTHLYTSHWSVAKPVTM